LTRATLIALAAFVLDVLVILTIPIAIVTLSIKRWPIWKAYGLCTTLYLIYAKLGMRFLFGGYFPSSYILVFITSGIDGLIPWHRHIPGVSYFGHTQREVDFMTIWYPVVALVLIPTGLLWIASVVWTKAKGSRRGSDDEKPGSGARSPAPGR